MREPRETHAAIDARRNAAQEEVIAELRAIASQRTAEADAMRQDLVTLRRTLGAENALAEANERLRERVAELENADYVVRCDDPLHQDRDALAAAVARVRALHSQDTSLLAPGKWCPACGDETPCRTIRALDAAPSDPASQERADEAFERDVLASEAADREVP